MNETSDALIQSRVKIHFMSLYGAILDYYGADSADHTFNIDGIIFKVLENPDDGYRSHLGPIDYSDKHSSLFFQNPIARVRIEDFNDYQDEDCSGEVEDFEIENLTKGYRLIDVSDGHVWLEFGTGNYDDYYPYFMFRHTPKETK